MNKIKLITGLALTLALTGCTDDNYTSVRHPEGEAQTVTDESLEENNGEQTAENQNPDQAEGQDQGTEENQEIEENQEEVTDDGINYTVENVVNVRVAPSENSNVMTTVNPGDDILKLGESDNWSRISIDGQTGYIRTDLLKAK
ncbi:SH3 domain-containing protein [Anaerococcus sp. Marseille-Q5996]|uniref:SH3 domain-containing protein n=1 Tax=Anaerococcus martiniensis TaxID=3115615 RepID=A0ABW9M7S4_9FIRM|nr:SH3 domain-containing protein [Anaerococcus sp. Marseille-Q5996]